MAKIIGLTAMEFVAQPDFRAQQSENGGWTATQSFIYTGTDLDNYGFRAYFAAGKKATDLCPSLPDWWEFLRLISVDIEQGEGGLATITVNYSGSKVSDSSGNGESAEVVTYSLSGTISQRTVLDHPSVVALGDADKKKLGLLLDGGIYWDATEEIYRQETSDNPFGDEITFTAGDAATFAAKIVMGLTTYDAPSFIWTEYKERTSGLAASELNDLGKVSVPSGNAPTPSGSRDWRLVSASQDFDGQLYRMTRAWELSEPGGWDEDVYDY